MGASGRGQFGVRAESVCRKHICPSGLADARPGSGQPYGRYLRRCPVRADKGRQAPCHVRRGDKEAPESVRHRQRGVLCRPELERADEGHQEREGKLYRNLQIPGREARPRFAD